MTKRGEKKEKKPLVIPSLADMEEVTKKKLGERVLYRGDELPELRRIPTGKVALDYVLKGGFPVDRITLLIGAKESSKTTTILQAAREYFYCCSYCLEYLPECICGKKDQSGKLFFGDIEGTYDPEWALHLGLDPDRVVVARAETGETALDLMEYAIRTNDVGIVATDSIAALCPVKELDQSFNKDKVGLQARMMNECFRKCASALHWRRANVEMPITIFFTNQIRYKIGVMWGSPETIPGGMGQIFMSALTLDLRKIGSAKPGQELDQRKLPDYPDADQDRSIKTKFRGKVKHSKVSSPGMECVFEMLNQDVGPGRETGTVDDYNVTLALAERWGFFNKGDAGYEFLGDTFRTMKEIIEGFTRDPLYYAMVKRRLVRSIWTAKLEEAVRLRQERQRDMARDVTQKEVEKE